MWKGWLRVPRASRRPYGFWLTVGRPTPSSRTMSQKLSILRPSVPSPLRLPMALLLSAVSDCHIALPEGEGHTPVILGEPGDEALLGVVTLENLGLIFHPFKRTLE